MQHYIKYYYPNFSLLKSVSIFVVLFLTLTNNALANELKFASIIESKPILYEVDGSKGLILNKQSLLYFTKLNNVDGLYKYDVLTKAIELVKPITINNSIGTQGGRPRAKGNNVSLMSIYGQVYATDGTSSGTVLIKDFDVYFDGGGSLGLLISKVNNIQFVNGKFYIRVFDYDSFTGAQSGQVWVSDGTVNGTTLVSKGHSRIEHVFSAMVNGRKTTHFLAYNQAQESELWKLDSQNQSSLVYSFGERLSFNTESTTTTNSKGSYLCSSNNAVVTSESKTTLWRVSNSGRLEIIENNCTPNTLAINGDHLIYYSNGELSRTTGGTNQKKLLARDVNSRSAQYCQNNNELEYLINNKIYSIRMGELVTVKSVDSDFQRSISTCLGDDWVLDRDLGTDSYSTSLINKTTLKETPIKEVTQIIGNIPDIRTNRIYIDNYLKIDNEIYGFGSNYFLNQNGRDFDSIEHLYMLKESKEVTIPLMLLLEE